MRVQENMTEMTHPFNKVTASCNTLLACSIAS